MKQITVKNNRGDILAIISQVSTASQAKRAIKRAERFIDRYLLKDLATINIAII